MLFRPAAALLASVLHAASSRLRGKALKRLCYALKKAALCYSGFFELCDTALKLGNWGYLLVVA